jgi:glutamate N-acetyltransferase/amino-acid N-acetyltransferase
MEGENGPVQLIEGSVTAPQGFLAAGGCAEIRKAGKKDLAVIYSRYPCSAAGVFTTNAVRAFCVDYNRDVLKSGRARAVVMNSGNANACNGAAGEETCRAMAARTASLLQLDPDEILLASTGVIGVPMPTDKAIAGLEAIIPALSVAGADDAAAAIMTTDLYEKKMAARLTLGEKAVKIGAIAKGSGMIHPNMATMLGFVTTDAAISVPCLQKALRDSVRDSYNMVSVDRDTSTNDMVLVLANGAAGNPLIEDAASPDYQNFAAALRELNIAMAKKIARDGEGATRLVEVSVQGAPDGEAARLIARSVVASNLVKAAIFGRDANWGRILCAAGNSGVPFDFRRVDIYLGELKVAESGAGLAFDENAAESVLARENVTIRLDMRQGPGEARAWGCDLTCDYVTINASYRT